jgi:hypothetical protein
VTGSEEDEAGTVLLEAGADGVATLTLNRPHRHNAWNPVLERRSAGPARLPVRNSLVSASSRSVRVSPARRCAPRANRRSG